MTTRAATANVFKGLDHDKAAHALAEVLAYSPDLGGLQEWGKQRDSILKAARAYDFARNDAGGGPVFWRRDRYGLVRCRAVVLARRSFVGHLTGRKSTLPDNIATLAILCDDQDGREVAAINAHLDAEVQTGGKYRTDKEHRPRVRRHKRQVRRLERLVRRQQRKGRRVFVFVDGNFDGLELDGLTSCWDGQPHMGTLGKRAVDIVFSGQKSRLVQTVVTGSDHKAVVADY